MILKKFDLKNYEYITILRSQFVKKNCQWLLKLGLNINQKRKENSLVFLSLQSLMIKKTEKSFLCGCLFYFIWY